MVHGELKQGIDGTRRIKTRIYMENGELKQGHRWYMEN